MPQYKVINGQGNDKKLQRLQEELNNLKNELSEITCRSHKLLLTLWELANKKTIESQSV
jgi:hypothetical protein